MLAIFSVLIPDLPEILFNAVLICSFPLSLVVSPLTFLFFNYSPYLVKDAVVILFLAFTLKSSLLAIFTKSFV
jgi:hypothetical protein|nr:MAG TPA: hypothetical protein [Caudoviricetes sp.]